MRSWTRRFALTVTALALGTTALGCTSSDDGSVSRPTAGGGSGGPGTAIFDGLKVQPGSRLIGVPVPADSTEQEATISSQALIAVEGDVETVYRSYLMALDDAGYAVGSNHCGVVGRVLECQTSDARFDPGGARPKQGRTMNVTLVAPNTQGDAFDTTMLITQQRHDPTVSTTSTTMNEFWRRLAAIPTTTRHQPSVAEVLAGTAVRTVTDAPVPDVGELVAPKWMDPDVGIRVEKGSHLLGPAAPLNGGTMGWTAVARVSGDPSDVRLAYLRQNPLDKIYTSSRKVDGRQVWFGWWSSAGGPKLYLTSVPDGDGGAYLWINVVND